MHGNYHVTLETEPQPEDMHGLVQGLTEFNADHAGGETPRYLLITIKDEPGKLAGGLLGATYLGWLQIQVVWLTDQLRGEGFGSTLLAMAEQEAVQRGCAGSFVETLSFQALPFYERAGYEVFSRLPDFPAGGARYALTKRLTGRNELN